MMTTATDMMNPIQPHIKNTTNRTQPPNLNPKNPHMRNPQPQNNSQPQKNPQHPFQRSQRSNDNIMLLIPCPDQQIEDSGILY